MSFFGLREISAFSDLFLILVSIFDFLALSVFFVFREIHVFFDFLLRLVFFLTVLGLVFFFYRRSLLLSSIFRLSWDLFFSTCLFLRLVFCLLS